MGQGITLNAKTVIKEKLALDNFLSELLVFLGWRKKLGQKQISANEMLVEMKRLR